MPMLASSRRRTIAAPLALCYAALVVYASLYPFSDWRMQGMAPWAYLIAPWPRYWTWFDVWTNAAGYVPLGFLLALAMARSGRHRWIWPAGCLGPALLSVLLEGVQSYLPQRVPSQVDALLNAGGGVFGAVLAVSLLQHRLIQPWNRFRSEWLVDEPAPGVAVLLLWPAALLYPTPVAYGLGQVWSRVMADFSVWLADTPFAPWLPLPVVAPPLSPLAEALVVSLNLCAPLLLGYALLRYRWQRVWCLAGWALVAVMVHGLSTALTYGPLHAWDGWTAPTVVGFCVAAGVGFACLSLSHRAVAALLLLTLAGAVGVLNGAPESPYFAASLEVWEQGQFIRFHGLSQWLGWLWPYATMGVGLRLTLRGPGHHYNP